MHDLMLHGPKLWRHMLLFSISGPSLFYLGAPLPVPEKFFPYSSKKQNQRHRPTLIPVPVTVSLSLAQPHLSFLNVLQRAQCKHSVPPQTNYPRTAAFKVLFLSVLTDTFHVRTGPG